MKVVLLHDTSDSRHFGCELVVQSYRDHFEKRGVELIKTYHKKELWDKKILDQADLVVINAEGSVHDNNYPRLLSVGHEYPAVFMNAVWQNNDNAYARLNEFQLVTVRESMSAEYMRQEHEYAPEIVPDVIFSHTEWLREEYQRVRLGTFMSNSSTRIPTCVERTADCKDDRFIDKLAASENACCGRFHAICVAAMLDIPFSAFEGNTWKIEGIMRDMGIYHHYRTDSADAIKIIPKVMPMSVHTYVEEAQVKIDDLFDRILS